MRRDQIIPSTFGYRVYQLHRLNKCRQIRLKMANRRSRQIRLVAYLTKTMLEATQSVCKHLQPLLSIKVSTQGPRSCFIRKKKRRGRMLFVSRTEGFGPDMNRGLPWVLFEAWGGRLSIDAANWVVMSSWHCIPIVPTCYAPSLRVRAVVPWHSREVARGSVSTTRMGPVGARSIGSNSVQQFRGTPYAWTKSKIARCRLSIPMTGAATLTTTQLKSNTFKSR
jgi:hypothetical protein